MFDTDQLIAECQQAIVEAEPRRAIREVLERTMAAPTTVADALRPREGGLDLLHVADDLTVLHVVWAPGMRLFPHNHLMWAAIGIYAGQEDNTFYRRDPENRRALVRTGAKEIVTSDVLLLGDDTIHAVENPTDRLTGAIHVYGGDFVRTARSQWGPGPELERPYDMDSARQQFSEANRVWREAGAAAP